MWIYPQRKQWLENMYESHSSNEFKTWDLLTACDLGLPPTNVFVWMLGTEFNYNLQRRPSTLFSYTLKMCRKYIEDVHFDQHYISGQSKLKQLISLVYMFTRFVQPQVR